MTASATDWKKMTLGTGRYTISSSSYKISKMLPEKCDLPTCHDSCLGSNPDNSQKSVNRRLTERKKKNEIPIPPLYVTVVKGTLSMG
jgi:hypothetical protein